MKRTAIKRRPLADTVLASLEPEDREYRESYGVDRLYFIVSPSGRKRWEMRYKKPETGRGAGWGTYPEVTARMARQRADEAFTLVQQGIDPVKHRKAQQQAEEASSDTLFKVSAEEWYQRKQQMERADKTLKGIRYWHDGDALPAIGNLPLDRIRRTQCRELQERIEARGAFNTAEKARTWLNQIVGYAIAHGRTENNPAARADHRLLRVARPTRTGRACSS